MEDVGASFPSSAGAFFPKSITNVLGNIVDRHLQFHRLAGPLYRRTRIFAWFGSVNYAPALPGACYLLAVEVRHDIPQPEGLPTFRPRHGSQHNHSVRIVVDSQAYKPVPDFPLVGQHPIGHLYGQIGGNGEGDADVALIAEDGGVQSDAIAVDVEQGAAAVTGVNTTALLQLHQLHKLSFVATFDGGIP